MRRVWGAGHALAMGWSATELTANARLVIALATGIVQQPNRPEVAAVKLVAEGTIRKAQSCLKAAQQRDGEPILARVQLVEHLRERRVELVCGRVARVAYPTLAAAAEGEACA